MDELLASTLRLAAPMLFAAMGGLLCERAGIATICLEGVLLFSALAAATAAFYLKNPWLGLGAGLLVGTLSMLLHAFLTVTAKADRIISGVAVNILAAGLTPLFCKLFFHSATNTESLPLELRMPSLSIPGLSEKSELFAQHFLVYVACLLPFLIHFYLYRTRAGNRIYAAGDGPKALETCGVSVARTRYLALALGGLLTSLGGVYLSIGHASQFTREMTAGKGFIALAALIFGKWKPIPTFLSCLFFAFTDAMQIRLQSMQWGSFEMPVQLLQALPYVVTLIVLAGFVGTARPPHAIVTGE